MRFLPQSFALLTYPFLFDPGTFELRKTAAGTAAWSTTKKTFPLWMEEAFGEEDLLPYVQRYLNPPPGVPATVCIWSLSADGLQSPEGLGTQARWSLQTPNRCVPFEIKAVKFVLFRVGVGFLSLQIRCPSSNEEEWLDLLHFSRYADRKSRVCVQIERRVGKDQVVPYFPPRAGGMEAHPDGKGTLLEILQALLRSAGEGAEPWWREVFVAGQLLPYAALFADEAESAAGAVLLYRMRHFFGTQQPLRPSAADLDTDAPSVLPYSEGQWFVFSLDGTAFVALNPPATPFMQVTMPGHLRDRYYLLFLMVLHQRFALMDLSERVAREWLQGDEFERAGAFERIRDALLDFTARGYFSQVMQTEHHHTVYRRWQDTFQVELLYREVSDEVREMHGSLMLRRTEKLQQLAEEQRTRDEQEASLRQAREKRLDTWFGRITFLLGGPAIALTFVQTVAAVGMQAALSWVAGAITVGILVIWWRDRGR